MISNLNILIIQIVRKHIGSKYYLYFKLHNTVVEDSNFAIKILWIS